MKVSTFVNLFENATENAKNLFDPLTYNHYSSKFKREIAESPHDYFAIIHKVSDTSYYFRLKLNENTWSDYKDIAKDVYIYSILEELMTNEYLKLDSSVIEELISSKAVKKIFTSAYVNGNEIPSVFSFGGFMPDDIFGDYSIRTFHIVPIKFEDEIILISFFSRMRFEPLKFAYYYELTWEKFSKFHFMENEGNLVLPTNYHNYTGVLEEDTYNSLNICSNCHNYYIQVEEGTLCYFCVIEEECFNSIDYTGDNMRNCRDCRLRQNCSRHIFEYNENLPVKFYHNDGTVTNNEIEGKTYYGIELELELNNTEKGLIKHFNNIKGYGENTLDFIYAKHDGSLDYGYEIVTQPSEYEYTLEKMKQIMADASRDSTSHNNGRCGLHIHINKNSFTELAIANIMQIIYTNWDDFVLFSRRHGRQINWCNKVYLNKNYDNTPTKIVGKDENRDKYVAVNIIHPDTIELRLFRGTLKYNTFVATMQLVKNLIELARSSTLEKAMATTFFDVVNYNKTEELQKYLVERGMVNEE